MTRGSWKKKIVAACEAAGTYEPFFEPIIETLADILQRRDRAQKQFKDEGEQIVIEHTNKGGNTNLEKNPILVIINELNRDALSYWRDLCLTPAAFKKLNEPAKVQVQQIKGNALAAALTEIQEENRGN